MAKVSNHIIRIISILLVCIQATFAQSGFYVPKKGKIFFKGDTATIFSNVTNQGQLGVGKNAVVNFKGKQWENDAAALITDESNNGNGITGIGGFIRFLTPDTSLPLTVNQQQIIIGGYNAASKMGATFSNIQIDNRWGVLLEIGSTKIRKELKFSNGHLYANDNIVVVGDGNPGVITGYNDNRFVVTGRSANGGFLLREGVSQASGLVVFPVGSVETEYTPAAIRFNHLVPDDFYTRVFDSVRKDLTSGQNLASQSVNKTWQIGKLLRPGAEDVDVVLQHRFNDEGTFFHTNRRHAYVSQFRGGAWDDGMPQSLPQAGYLTTGGSSLANGTNMRGFTGTISSESYFTKFTGFGDTSTNKTRFWFSAYRKNYQHVDAFWNTNPEINVQYFVVQRMLSTETVFTNRDTVLSKAINGRSFDNLSYIIDDPNNFAGISYYRLMLVDYFGNVTYSNIVPVGGHPQKFEWIIWPNPSTGRFKVGIGQPSAVSHVVIYNAIGQLLHKELVNNRGIIEMYIRTPGTYVVGLVSTAGYRITSKKVVIKPY